MKLRDLIPAADIEDAVHRIVESLLDQEVAVTLTGEDGTPLGSFLHQEFVCDICGDGPFKTNSALGGHKYHKHGVKAEA